MAAFHPVHVHADRAIAAGALVWRYRDALNLTAIVKATFATPLDEPISLAEPEDLFSDDLRLVHHPHAVIRPSDRVPYRSRADIIVRAAPRPPGKVARISLRGRSGPIFEKPISPWEDASQLGPIARAWPPTGVLDLASDFDWSRLQAAPPDQQTAYLRGDEWIVLEGLHPALEVLSIRLPDARATGIAYVEPGSAGPWSQPIVLHADQLLVDLAELRCTLTWRAVLPIASADQLAAIRLDLGLELAGHPVRSAAKPPAARKSSTGAHNFEQTVAITTIADAPVIVAAPVNRPSVNLEGTMTISSGDAAGGASPMPAPFPIAAASSAERVAPIAGAPWSAARAAPAPTPSADFEHTLTLRDDRAAPIAGAPWSAARAAPAPTPSADLDHTLTLRAGPAAPAVHASPEPHPAVAHASEPPRPTLETRDPAAASDPRDRISRRLPRRKS